MTGKAGSRRRCRESPLASTVRRIDAMWRVLGCSGDGYVDRPSAADAA